MSDRKLRVNFDEEKIDSIFAEVDQSHLPGAAVGIAIDGKPVYRKGFGLASMDLPVVLSPSTRMRIGSVTKHFTCLAYLLLAEDGKAGIDDELGRHLPELNPVTHKVTIRQLMGHLGGLRDPCSMKIAFAGPRGRPDSNLDVLSLYRDIDDMNFAPGTTWMYSNGGFVLLTAVIERIAGQRLEDVLRERIFDPIGLRDTLLHRCAADFIASCATSHMTKPGGGFERAYWGMDFAGGGAMVSTVDDMLRWLAHMDAPVVGSPKTWALMTTPQRLINGTVTDYSLGLRRKRYRGVEIFNHGGGWLGANAMMLKVPAAALDIVIMVNRHDVASPTLAAQIMEACVPDLEQVEEASDASVVTGAFRSPSSGRVIQLAARNGQQAVSINGYELPFKAGQDGVLRVSNLWMSMQWTIEFIGDPTQPAALRFSDFGNVDELELLESVCKPDTSTMVGHYRSDTTGIEGTVQETDDGVRLSIAGRFGPAEFSLKCLGANVWSAQQVGALSFLDTSLSAVLSFGNDEEGFDWSSGDTRSLRFRRYS